MSGLACDVKMRDLTDMPSSCFSYKERSCLLCQVGLSTSVLEGGRLHDENVGAVA